MESRLRVVVLFVCGVCVFVCGCLSCVSVLCVYVCPSVLCSCHPFHSPLTTHHHPPSLTTGVGQAHVDNFRVEYTRVPSTSPSQPQRIGTSTAAAAAAVLAQDEFSFEGLAHGNERKAVGEKERAVYMCVCV